MKEQFTDTLDPRKKILVVDDNKRVQVSLSDSLSFLVNTLSRRNTTAIGDHLKT